ncbi:RPEL repeat protein [Phanerochaete sordida]|uniref:RPEL repeat protein n=1 Tax=Phanerochaete sordida TaxID=48140 RepID=A0A9P3GHH9_9APHY|nr:RPEL repeat protein [Phanerochaete sordida]
MSSAETGTATDATKPTPTRKGSIDVQTVESLEKRLNQRPEKKDLVDRNILKDDKVAPSLQAAKEKLERSQLEDKLGHALVQRPKREELEQQGILQPDASTPATASA